MLLCGACNNVIGKQLLIKSKGSKIFDQPALQQYVRYTLNL